MRRRQFITSATATVATASIAGCSGILGDGGGGGGPSEPVKTYLKAGVNGDQEALQESVHPDASSSLTSSGAMLGMAESINIKNTEVVEESEDEATVDVTAEVSMMGESSESTARYVVRKDENDDWKVYAAGE